MPQVWPEVLAMIQACNIRNYSIFRHGTQLFAYFEYLGEDFAADMAKMAADPKTREPGGNSPTLCRSRCLTAELANGGRR